MALRQTSKLLANWSGLSGRFAASLGSSDVLHFSSAVSSRGKGLQLGSAVTGLGPGTYIANHECTPP